MSDPLAWLESYRDADESMANWGWKPRAKWRLLMLAIGLRRARDAWRETAQHLHAERVACERVAEQALAEVEKLRARVAEAEDCLEHAPTREGGSETFTRMWDAYRAKYGKDGGT